MDTTYIAVIEGKDDNYGAFVPDVLGAVGAGDSVRAALDSLAQSLAIQLRDLHDRQQPIPQPSRRENIDLSDFDPEEPYQFCEVRAALP